MNAEFGLGSAELIGDRDRIIQLFDNFLAQHENELKEANRLLHCVRREALTGKKLTSGSIDENAEKFASVNPNTLQIVKRASGQALYDLMKIKHEVKPEDIDQYDPDFSQLNSSLNWRGKFIFFLFKRFISILIEDRNSSTPRFFSVGKGKISFDTKPVSYTHLTLPTKRIV